MHCGHCVPCLIRRAAIKEGLGTDPTTYHLKNLKSGAIDSTKAVGEHIRSFQRSIERLKRKPSLAQFDIHRPGPLNDYPKDWEKYRLVYVNGLAEVGRLLKGVITKPL